MTEEEAERINQGIIAAQSRAFAAVFLLESILLEIAKSQSDVRTFLSRILEHTLARLDAIDPAKEKPPMTDARDTIERLIARVARQSEA